MPISIFENNSHKHKTLADKLVESLIDQGGVSVTKDTTEKMIALESANFTQHERQDLLNKYSSIRGKLDALVQQIQPDQLGQGKKINRSASLEAAALGGMLASNIPVAVSRILCAAKMAVWLLTPWVVCQTWLKNACMLLKRITKVKTAQQHCTPLCTTCKHLCRMSLVKLGSLP
jgi:hypothetical protein